MSSKQTAFAIYSTIAVIVIVYFADNITNNNYSKVYSNTSVRVWKLLRVEELLHRSSARPHVQRASRCNYVGFFTTGNRLGNHMFFYAGLTYVAWLTGRRPCIWTKPGGIIFRYLHSVFDLDIKFIDLSTLGCPYYYFRQHGAYTYDKRIESLINISDSESLWIEGSFASWMYAYPVATQLRQNLRFRKEITEFVADFLSSNVPPGWTTLTFICVGVHVRRGDFLKGWARKEGFTVAGERYLQRAMNYFVERFPRIQFIVASNDIRWCQKHITVSMFNRTDVKITFSEKHSAGQDLALLANCDHTVITTGTYSWWAAFLANGTTVYYASFPRRGSKLATRVRLHEFNHPNWIGFVD